MRKIGIVAATEFGSVVRTKAFLIAVLFFPILMVGISVLQQTLGRHLDTTPRRFAVIDTSGQLYEPIAQTAAVRNAALVAAGALAREPRFEPERVESAGRSLDDLRVALCDRVRKEQLFAFVEIGGEGEPIRYYSDHPTYDELRVWLADTINDQLRARRYRAAGIDEALVAKLELRVESEHLGLVARGPDGRVQPAQKVDQIKATVLPIILMLMLFMPVMISAPQQLNTVIEEKMSRVSEVLLGSVKPFELMMGKLLGSVGVSILLALLYVGGGYAVAMRLGYADMLSLPLVAAFVLFLVLAMLLYGSLYIAVGAACNELKDAQTLMMPVVVLSMLPALTFMPILSSPSSGYAVGMSLVPPLTPFLMLLRMALHPSPPAWQIALGIALTVATALGCVWAAGRVFRVGLLAQGKSASFGQMMKWVLAK